MSRNSGRWATRLTRRAHALRTAGLGSEASQAMQAALRVRDAAGLEGA